MMEMQNKADFKTLIGQDSLGGCELIFAGENSPSDWLFYLLSNWSALD